MDWVPAVANMPLRSGDAVVTDPGSAARIVFQDGTSLAVRPETLLTIEGIADWRMGAGGASMRAERKNAQNPPEVTTPLFEWKDSEESTDPAAVDIEVKSTGEGRVDQRRGKGRVKTARGPVVDVEANERVSVDRRGEAGPKSKLPEPPALLAPPHQAQLSYPDPVSSETVLSWRPVEGAASYHLLLDDDGWFLDPIVDRRKMGETSARLPALREGKYYWCVSAVDARGNEGPFSDFFRFAITAGAGPTPRLVIETLEIRKNVLHIRGRTDPGASLTVNNQAVEVQPDGSFSEFLTLDGAGEKPVRVRAQSAGGRFTEQVRRVILSPL